MGSSVSIDIDAPEERVWAEAVDFAAHAEWMRDVRAIKFGSDRREGVGTVLLIETRVGPFRTVDRFEITEVEPMRLVAGRHSGLFTGEGRFDLSEPAPGRTRFTWRERIRFPWYFGGPAGAWVARWVLARIWRANLRMVRPERLGHLLDRLADPGLVVAHHDRHDGCLRGRVGHHLGRIDQPVGVHLHQRQRAPDRVHKRRAGQNCVVLDCGRDHATLRPSHQRRSLDRQIVGLGTAPCEHDLQRIGIEQGGGQVPGVLKGVLGAPRDDMTTRGVPVVLIAERRHRLPGLGSQRGGGGVVEVQHGSDCRIGQPVHNNMRWDSFQDRRSVSPRRPAQPRSVSSRPMQSASSLPEALPEEQRLNSAYSLPGGYRGYLNTLRQICDAVDRVQPSRDSLVPLLQSELAISPLNSKDTVSFLLRIDLLHEEAGRCRLGNWTRRWLDDDDAGILIALLHSRVRFIGEMLTELQKTPRSTPELRSIAIEQYGFSWKQDKPISNRRGWLQSAGFIEVNADKKLTITDAGRAFLTRLGVLSPSHNQEPTPDPVPAVHEPVARPEPVPDSSPVDDLATEVEESSTDSQNPGRFERAVRDAFAFLGFQAELLGGSGKTDVLLMARLGRSDSYKVTVDAKTTASGRLLDMRVDWATLVEHRTKEAADHSLLVGPDPRGNRLFYRAVDHEVTVLSAQRLAEQCRRHARSALGLDDYRLLFTKHGEADLAELDKRAERSERLRVLAADICRKLAERWNTVGYHTARDLWMLLPKANTEIIQSVLDALASPLVGAINGDPENGYVLATDPKVVQLRLTLLGEKLTSTEPAG